MKYQPINLKNFHFYYHTLSLSVLYSLKATNFTSVKTLSKSKQGKLYSWQSIVSTFATEIISNNAFTSLLRVNFAAGTTLGSCSSAII